jgi:4-amino-4-deoxy-L-arabinose transferase-like glycosyltransferase
VSFFVFARVVIFDMSLTFFVVLALFSFYMAAQAQMPRSRWLHCAVMYAAVGAGTLIKGAVAVALPGMVVLAYLAFSRRWSLLGRLHLGRGVLVYLAVILPWYAWSELRNPGYLRYFIFEEHWLRYTTAEFERSHGWYYFIVVAAVGFFPWVGLLPATARDAWRSRHEQAIQFLVPWALLPVVFFSFSQSQLPQYILPVFPALALITGRCLADRLASAGHSAWRCVVIPWICVMSVMIYFALGGVWPAIAVRHIRPTLAQNAVPLALCSATLVIILAICVRGYLKNRWTHWPAVFLSTATALTLFFTTLAQLTTPVSVERGSKTLARLAAPFITPQDRVVFYDTYLPAVPFYLSLEKPSWIVQNEERGKVLGSNYLAGHRRAAAAGLGQVVFSFAEFAEVWKRSDLVLRVFVKEKNLRRLSLNVGAAPKILTGFDEYLLVTNH